MIRQAAAPAASKTRVAGEKPFSAMLAREIRLLIEIHALMDAGQSVSSAMQKKGIRRNHEAPVAAALRRLRQPQLEDMLRSARQVDLAAKGMNKDNPWQGLSDLVLTLAGTPPLVAGLMTG